MGNSLAEQMQQGRARAAVVELRRCEPEQPAVLPWREAREAFAQQYWSALVARTRSVKGAAALAGVRYDVARKICSKFGIRSPTARGRFPGEQLTPEQRTSRKRLSATRSKQRQRAADQQQHSMQSRSQS